MGHFHAITMMLPPMAVNHANMREHTSKALDNTCTLPGTEEKESFQTSAGVEKSFTYI